MTSPFILKATIAALAFAATSRGTQTVCLTPTGTLDCQEDNCLREVQDVRFSSLAAGFCATYTTIVNTAPTAIPTYLENCGQNPSAVSSACSCLLCPTTTTTSSATPSSTAVPFNCSKYGYLIQGVTGGAALYQVDLETGGVTVVSNPVGTYTGINALAFNVLDNYLYGYTSSNDVIRISQDGSTRVITSLVTDATGTDVGDIDANGYYWFGRNGATWNQLDLRPGSLFYGRVLSSGTVTVPTGARILDWVYLQGHPGYLYTAASRASGGVSVLRFSLLFHTWQVLDTYPNVAVTSFGAIYGASNGTFWASDNDTGDIWRFVLGEAPVVASHGPKSGQNDGARCAAATF